MVPSIEVLACKFGVLTPKNYTCLFASDHHDDLPRNVPSFSRFVDFDPLPDSLAGRLDLGFGVPLAGLNLTTVQVALSSDGQPQWAARSPADLRAAVAATGKGASALSVWLPRAAVAAGFLEAEVSLGNGRGFSPPGVSLPMLDLVVRPAHPQMDQPFEVSVPQFAGSLRLSLSETCERRWFKPMAAPSKFKVLAPLRYSVCGCAAGADCSRDEDHGELLGVLAVHGPAPSLSSDAAATVPGTPFFLEIFGTLLHPLARLVAEGCAHHLRGLHRESVAGSSGYRFSTQRWVLVASEPGQCNFAWADHRCSDDEAACAVQQVVWGQPLNGTVSILPCSPTCRSCRGLPTSCTACFDDAAYLHNGTCVGLPPRSPGDLSGRVLEPLYSSASPTPILTPMLPSTSSERAIAALGEPNVVHRPECNKEMRIHCRLRASWDAASLRLTMPRSMAALSTTELLIVDPYFEVPVGGDAGATSDTDGHTSRGAVFVLDMASGELDFACPTCCADDLLNPEAVRVSPTGAFWLIVDTGNAAIRRVDALTHEMTLVAGRWSRDGVLDSCRFSSGALWEPTPISQDGVVEDALGVRLCQPSDVSIHEDERRFLVVERGGCRGGSLPRARLIDEHEGTISTIKSFDAGCSGALHVEWLAGGSERFAVAACGRVELFAPGAGGSWTATPLERPAGSPLSGAVVFALRAAAVGDAMLFLTSPGGGGSVVIESQLEPDGEDVVVAGTGTVPLHDGTRQWASDTLLLNVTAIVAALDGSVVVGAVARHNDTTKSNIFRVVDRCPPGTGVSIQVGGGAGTRRCEPCSRGSHNNGSFIECRSCFGQGTGTLADGAVSCDCMPGFYKVDQGTLSCRTCTEGWYCPGSGDPQVACLGESTTFADDDHSVSTHLSSELGEGNVSRGPLVPLRKPGFRLASSSRQCDCCFGWCKGCTSSGSCSACPEGFWCAGALAAPESQVRVRNGFVTDWAGESGHAFSAAALPWSVFRCAHPSQCWWAPHPLTWQALAREPCLLAAKSGRCQAGDCAGVQVGRQAEAVGGTPCSGGREGLACGRCAPGSFAPARDEDCRDCGWVAGKLILASVLFFAAMAALHAALLRRDGLRDRTVYAVLSVLAVLADQSEQLRLLSFTMLEWPHGGVPDFLWRLSGLSVWMVAPVHTECLAGTDIAARWALALVLGVACFAVPAVVVAMHMLGRKCLSCFPSWGAAPTVGVLLNLMLLCSRMLASPMLAFAMGFFQCYSHPGASSLSLWYSPDVLCFADDWGKALPWAMLFMLLPLGLFAAQIYTTRRVAAATTTRFTTPADRQALERSRWQWCRLRLGMLGWDKYVQVRMLLMQAAFFLEGMPDTQLYILFVLNMISMVAIAVKRPNMEPSVNVFELVVASASQLLVVAQMGLLPRSVGGGSVAQRRGIDLSSRMALAGGIAVCVFTIYIMCIAGRDLLMPARGAKKEAKKVTGLAERLLNLAEGLTMLSCQELLDGVQFAADGNFKLMSRTVRSLSQVWRPPSERAHVRSVSRLCIYDIHDAQINKDLEESRDKYNRETLHHRMSTGASVCFKEPDDADADAAKEDGVHDKAGEDARPGSDAGGEAAGGLQLGCDLGGGQDGELPLTLGQSRASEGAGVDNENDGQTDGGLQLDQDDQAEGISPPQGGQYVARI